MWLVLCGDQDMVPVDLHQGFQVTKKETADQLTEYFPLEEILPTQWSCGIYLENIKLEKMM